MTQSRLTEYFIIGILADHEAGTRATELPCRHRTHPKADHGNRFWAVAGTQLPRFAFAMNRPCRLRTITAIAKRQPWGSVGTDSRRAASR